MVCDSDLCRPKYMPSNWLVATDGLAEGMIRLSVWYLGENQTLTKVNTIEENRRRLIVVPLNLNAKAIRVVFEKSWGGKQVTLFGAECGDLDVTKPLRPIAE